MERSTTTPITRTPGRQKKELSFVSVGGTSLLLVFLGFLLWYVWPTGTSSEGITEVSASVPPAVEVPPVLPPAQETTGNSGLLQSQGKGGAEADTFSTSIPSLDEVGGHPMFAPLLQVKPDSLIFTNPN